MGRVESIFRPNPSWLKKKNQPSPTHHRGLAQPNPHGLGWVGLNPWVGQRTKEHTIRKKKKKKN